MENLKKCLYLTATIVATVIGAGFATGQEIYSFFNIYGKWSFIGFGIVFALFFFAFKAILGYCCTERIDCFADYLRSLHLYGLENWIEACVALFSFCGFCAMASATGALFAQIFQIDYLYGTFFMLILCSAILLKDIRAIATTNLILAPLICIGIVYFSVRGILFRSIQTIAASHYYINIAQICLSALVYASYNVLSAVAVLCSMRRYCDSKRTINTACVAAGGILAGLGLLIWLTIAIYSGKVELGEIPMLRIAARGGGAQTLLYSLLLVASVLTTALGCGYAALDFLKSRFKTANFTGVVVLTLGAVPVCLLGFEDIVRVLYSFFGYLGLPFLVFLVVRYIKNRRNVQKKSKKYGK